MSQRLAWGVGLLAAVLVASVASGFFVPTRGRAGAPPGPAVNSPPYIVSIDPPYEPFQHNVSLTAPIVVTFSEAMRNDSVHWTFDPRPTLTVSWDPSGTVLNLTHTDPYEPCHLYIFMVMGGYDLEGELLADGPVPKNTNFTAECALGEPQDLTVTELPPDSVLLTWTKVPGASSYEVFTSPDRFASFPSGWTPLGTSTTTQYPADGHLTDGVSHFYVVRAVNGVLEGATSAMGAKIVLSFGFAPASTNIAWFSLPYVSGFAKASDIAARLGPDAVGVIGKWDASRQTSVVYYFARGGWRGTDFPIAAGDGLYVSVKRPLTWVVTGTDMPVVLSFAANGPPRANVNWCSVPYTAIYRTASEIADELGPARVVEIGLWDSGSQTAKQWSWTGAAWAGTDFIVAAGTGLYLIVASDFTWTPALISLAAP